MAIPIPNALQLIAAALLAILLPCFLRRRHHAQVRESHVPHVGCELPSTLLLGYASSLMFEPAELHLGLLVQFCRLNHVGEQGVEVGIVLGSVHIAAPSKW